jgi:hypothetical protein
LSEPTTSTTTDIEAYSPCDFDGCHLSHKAFGFCDGHYQQLDDDRTLAPLKKFPSKSVVVLAEELLATIVMPWIDERGGIDPARVGAGRKLTDPIPTSSALNRLAFDAAPRVGQSVDSIKKRIWQMRQTFAIVVSAALADAFALACEDVLAYSQLTHLAGTTRGSREMVDAWADENEPQMTADERRRLAEKLLRFSFGVVEGYDTDAARNERANEKQKQDARRHRRRTALAEAA